jgi:pyridoxal phosphate enzyme (YggS family)
MEPNNHILENFNQIIRELPPHVQLVAVTKTYPAESVHILYGAGHRTFGENRVQELLEKHAQLPKDIKWHLIGNLQSNKVKQIAAFIDTIESIDSEKILTEVNRQAGRVGRKINVLLQVKIAREDTKFGLTPDEARELFENYVDSQYENVIIDGLMGMATFTEDEEQIKSEFKILKALFDEFSAKKKLNTLSMGMSGDYGLAIECGATSVRIGSGIFGPRQYVR